MESVRILGTGSYLPSTILTNYDLEKRGLDTTHEWIVKRTGISERRIAAAGETASDLGHQASLKALEMAGLTAAEMDLIIVATITPDTCCPSAANWLQAKLAAPQAVTFDVTAACSGFIFGLNVAEQYLKNKTCKKMINKHILDESILKVGRVLSVEGRTVKVIVDRRKNISLVY